LFCVDVLGVDLPWVEFAVVVEPEVEEELPLAASAIAAPPPAMIPTATTVARPRRHLFIGVHLLRSSRCLRRVNRLVVRDPWQSPKRLVRADTPAT